MELDPNLARVLAGVAVALLMLLAVYMLVRVSEAHKFRPDMEGDPAEVARNEALARMVLDEDRKPGEAANGQRPPAIGPRQPPA